MTDGGDSDMITGPVKTNHAKAELLVIIIVININRMIKITPGKCPAIVIFWPKECHDESNRAMGWERSIRNFGAPLRLIAAVVFKVPT